MKRTSGSFAACILERGTFGRQKMSLEAFTTTVQARGMEYTAEAAVMERQSLEIFRRKNGQYPGVSPVRVVRDPEVKDNGGS